MKSEGHFYASRNDVLHNPVHHRYREKWIEWPFSSAAEFLESAKLVGETRWGRKRSAWG